MEEEKKKKNVSKWLDGLPPVGQRMVRSAVGVLCCVIVYYLRGRQGTPFYSALAVLWCIQPYAGSTKTMAIQRTVGTLVGAAFGFVTLLAQIYLVGERWRYLLTGFMIIPVIYFTLLIKKRNASYFSCVVFLSITIVHLGDANPYLFVVQRAADTFIGIFLGIVINSVHLPRKKIRDALFVAQLDDALDHHKENLTPYSKVELNRIIDDGANLTLATMRTPASLMEPMTGVRLPLPIIVMDGAALYDIGENSFIQAYVLSNKTAGEICSTVKKHGLHCFVNALADNTLIIYHGDFVNETELAIYNKLRKSPYRNYVKRDFGEEDMVVYIMCVDRTEWVQELYEELSAGKYGDKLKMLFYPSADYPGYSYIKIYNKNASVENMTQYLMEEQHLNKVCRIGSDESCDVRILGTDLNSVAKTLKNTYEPVWFGKKNFALSAKS